MTGVIFSSNVILVLVLTVLFVREWRRRRALEIILQQSITYWRKMDEANLRGRRAGVDLPDDDGLRQASFIHTI